MTKIDRYQCDLCRLATETDIDSKCYSWMKTDTGCGWTLSDDPTQGVTHICEFCVNEIKDSPDDTPITLALQAALHVMEKGMLVRMNDQWPALQIPLENAIEMAQNALGKKP